MCNKIALYSHILNFGIIYLKCFVTSPFYKKIFSSNGKYISELIHLIPSRLYSLEYDKGDIEFIENELKRFAQEYPDKTDYTFMMIMDASLSLYDEVSDKFQLKWRFPDHLRNSIEQYRECNRPDD
jgi:hypothetical protein